MGGDDGTPPRVIFTAGRRLIALDAATGTSAAGFGQSGEIDMVIPYNSVPLVYENVVVVGANTPRGAPGGIGNARAFDARTGAKVWEFSSVPQPGSIGHDTWEGDSWVGRLGANAWPFYFTMDEERGHLYVPLASPIPFAYGGDRAGANLFANSLVAVDIRTGEYVWHFQTIHHDLWDHDPPAAPVLFDIPRDGGTVAALGVTTKSGYLYILDRDTGEPVFGVEERPVAQSEVPGEQTFPTQPIPVNPPALARVSYEPADLVSAEDTSPEHAAACADLVESVGEIYNAGAFTLGCTARTARPAGPRSCSRDWSVAPTGAEPHSIPTPGTSSYSRRMPARSAGWRTPQKAHPFPTSGGVHAPRTSMSGSGILAYRARNRRGAGCPPSTPPRATWCGSSLSASPSSFPRIGRTPVGPDARRPSSRLPVCCS